MIATAVGLSSLTLPDAASAQVPEIERAARAERIPLAGAGDERPAGRLGVGTTSAVAPTLEPTPANYFTRAGAGLTEVGSGSSSFGDVNGDGHLDLVITGDTNGSSRRGQSATLYIGDGQGGFTSLDAGLAGVYRSSSAFGDVNNDGNLDLVITGGKPIGETTTATLYIGDGRGGFAPQDAGLLGVSDGSSTFGDVNNDGNLDLLITGSSSGFAPTATLYIGDGQGGFTPQDTGLTGVDYSSSAFGDVNNDGNLDLVITGEDANRNQTATLYLGDGQGGFVDANAELTGVSRGSSSLGDVNGDGDLDLFITGNTDGFRVGGELATLYLGDGQGGFTDAEAGLTGVQSDASSLGDMNDDGNLDLLITGSDMDSEPTATFYLGDGQGGFASQDAGLTGVNDSSTSLGDIDGDGDVDLVITGNDDVFGPSARVYINRTVQEPPNQAPVIIQTDTDASIAPGLTITRLIEAGDPDGDRLTLTLAEGNGTSGASLTDAGNGLAELTFNPSRDQAGERTRFTVTARDASGFSATSAPITITVGDNFLALDAGLGGVGNGSTSAFGDVDGDGNLDLVLAGYSTNFDPSATLYLGDGQGGFTLQEAGLTGVFQGPSSAFGDVNNDGHLDLVVTGWDATSTSTATLYLGDGQGGFAPQDAGLSGVRFGSSSLGDVNNDGNLDLVITGEGQSTLYLGDGQGGFASQDAELTGVTNSSSTFGDVNNDGNLDFVITGEDASRNVTATLYLGDGQGGFSPQDVGMIGVFNGSSTFGDVNEDGDLDLIIVGSTNDGSGSATLYLGDGQGGFAAKEAGLNGVSGFTTSSSLGDVDGNSTLDLIITGEDQSSDNFNPTTTLYLGNGRGDFTAREAGLEGVTSGSSSFGDIDNDGLPDLIVSGEDLDRRPTVTLYENLSPGDFQVATATQAVTGDGPVSFGATGVSVEFVGTSGSGDVTVQRFANTPRLPLGISEANVSTYRFVVSAPGTLTFGSGTELRLDVGTLGGIGTPSSVTVYTRAVRGEGVFRPVPTTYDASAGEDGELVAQVSSFSEFVLASDDTSNPLPVELSRLSATLEGEHAVLTWQTTSETDNAGFEVERQARSGGWRKLGRVAGAGTTPEPQSYRFRDTALPYSADSLTYRLRQVDLDGTTTLSEEITLTRAAVTDLELLGTYPNPARTRATIRFAVPARADGGEATLQLYDLLGRRVRQVLTSGTAGRHEQQLDVSGLSSGLYVLRLVAGGEVRTQRITVVR
jgi:predicted nucleotidyltransferase